MAAEKPVLRWNKLSPSDISGYADDLTAMLLCAHDSPRACSNYHCENGDCKSMIERDYENVVAALRAADSKLPRHKPGVKKDWWTPQLTELKQQSIDIHRLWITEGRPRHGATHLERIRVRASYKQAIGTAQRAPKQEAWNRLHTALSENDTNNFYNGKSTKPAPVVNGLSAKDAIAKEFAKCFKTNSEPNNINRVNEINETFAREYETFSGNHSSNCNCNHLSFTLQHTFDAINSMKTGKCADNNGISSEHFHHHSLF